MLLSISLGFVALDQQLVLKQKDSQSPENHKIIQKEKVIAK